MTRIQPIVPSSDSYVQSFRSSLSFLGNRTVVIIFALGALTAIAIVVRRFFDTPNNGGNSDPSSQNSNGSDSTKPPLIPSDPEKVLVELKKANEKIVKLEQQLASKEKWGNYQENSNYVLAGRNFCSHWTLVDAIRDLLQNAIDSMLEVHRSNSGTCKQECNHWISLEKPPSHWEETKEWVLPFFVYSGTKKQGSPCGYLSWKPKTGSQGPTLTIINIGGKFDTSALIVGHTTKKNDGHNAGGHGEGLKAVAAVACRTQLQFEIYQSSRALHFFPGNIELLFHWKKPDNNDLCFSQLTRNFTENFNLSSENDVIVHLGGGKNFPFQFLQEAAQKFLSLTHREVKAISLKEELDNFNPVIIHSAVENRTVVDERGWSVKVSSRRALLQGKGLEHKVYVKGILFNTLPKDQKNWGVDLAKEDASNRDRSYVFPREYHIAVGKIITGVIDGSSTTDFAKELLRELEEATQNAHIPEHLIGLTTSVSNKTREIFRKLFKDSHRDLRYLIPGTLDKASKENELTPRWCDIRVCQIVHPLLYEILSGKEYPSLEAIREECSQKLRNSPRAKEASEKLRNWIRTNRQFLSRNDNIHLEETSLNQIEVRDSDALDVPQYVVVPTKPLPKLIFSYRTTKLDQPHTQRDLLFLINQAFEEIYPNGAGVKRPNPQKEHPVSKSSSPAETKKPLNPTEPSSSSSTQPPKISSPNLTPNLKPIEQTPSSSPQIPSKPTFYWPPFSAQKNETVPDDGAAAVNNLLTQLTRKVRFKNFEISCSSQSLPEWDAVMLNNQRFIELAEQAIEICKKATTILCGSDKPLKFYLAKESSILGYASELSGININLGSLLSFVSLSLLFPPNNS